MDRETPDLSTPCIERIVSDDWYDSPKQRTGRHDRRFRERDVRKERDVITGSARASRAFGVACESGQILSCGYVYVVSDDDRSFAATKDEAIEIDSHEPDDIEGLSYGFAGDPSKSDEMEKAWLRSALTAKRRPALRPIRIDDQGRAYEITGEQFVPPGLKPEDMIEVFSPDDETRAKPLSEIIASRAKNELRDQAQGKG